MRLTRLSQCFVFLVLLMTAALVCAAQNLPPAPQQADRATAPTPGEERLALRGHIAPAARTELDLGALDGATTLQHLVLTLTRDAAVQEAFDALSTALSDPKSAYYRQWLTPAQVGEMYGPTVHDVREITRYLQENGLTVESVSPSRTAIMFSGRAERVGAAFGTAMHRFARGDNSVHYAPSAEPTLPRSLAPLVLGIVGLTQSDFSLNPRAHPVSAAGTGTAGTASDQYSTRYGLAPFQTVSINGAGVRVAVLASSRVNNADIAAFQSQSNFPANLPFIIVPPFTTDPGITGGSAQAEATLDIERVVGTAPGAPVDLIAGADLSNNTLLGLINYASQTLNDPIMNLSFYGCEHTQGQAATLSFDQAFQTAHMQGIAVYVASGDSGAAGCEVHGQASSSNPVLSANALCSSQWVTCIGGTDITSNGEAAWNEPGTTNFVVVGSGGGASVYIAKPSYQTGLGVPADGARDTPDLSLVATESYSACIYGTGTTCNSYSVGGTSASTPTVAGMNALWNQQSGKRLGMLNSSFYAAAASNISTGLIHDVNLTTAGVTTCDLGTPSICNNSTPSSFNLTGGLKGYALAPGYDQVTGLGTLDAYNFGQYLYGGTAKAPLELQYQLDTYYPFSNDPINGGRSALFTATFPAGTSPAPTGYIEFYQPEVLSPPYPFPLAIPQTTPVSTEPLVTQSLTSSSTSTNMTVVAHYSGDGNYAPAEYKVVVPFTGKTSPTLTFTSSAPVFYSPGQGGTTSYLASATTPVQFTVKCSNCSGTAATGKMYFIWRAYGDYGPTGANAILGEVDNPTAANTWTLSAYLPYSQAPAGGVCGCSAYGADDVYAIYVGDTTYAPSGTTDLVIVSTAGFSSTTAYTSNYNVGWNTPFPVSCSIHVTGSGKPVPSFTLNGTNLVQLALSGGTLTSPVTIAATGDPTTFIASATGVMNVSGVAASAQEIDCSYYGDSYYFPSTLSRAHLTVAAQPTLAGTITASPGEVFMGKPVALTATFTASPASSPAPTGAVTFYSGSAAIGTGTLSATGTPGVYMAALTYTFSTAGSYAVKATIAGDGEYATTSTANSPTVVVVGNTGVVAALSVANPNAGVGQQSIITLTITTPSATSPAPSNNVVVKYYVNGSVYLATTGFTAAGNGAYTQIVTPSLAVLGTNTIYAVFPGDGLYQAQTSNSITVTVSKAVPVISPPATTTYPNGSAPTLTLSILQAGNTFQPSGRASYGIDSVGGTLTPIQANETFTIPIPVQTAPGTHTIYVNYAGDTNFAAAPQLTFTITLTQVTPTITWLAPAAIAYGTALSATQLDAQASTAGSFAYTPAAGTVLQAGAQTLSALFTPTDTTGYSSANASVGLMVTPAPLAVTVANATKKYGAPNPAFTTGVTGTVNGDVFTSSVSTTATMFSPVGTYSLVPSVAGANIASYAVTATNGTFTITQAGSSSSLQVSPATVGYTSPETFTVNVASATNGVPTGTVQFMNGSTPLGSATFSGGTATFMTSTLAVGSYSVTAVYGGDGNFTGSTSSAMSVTVTAPTATLALSAAATSTTVGTADLLTLKVTPTGSVVPTGSVSFYDNGALLGSAALAASGGAYAASYSVTFTTATTHSLTAIYSGGSGYVAQNSSPLSISVTKTASTLTAPATTTTTYGTAASIAVTVAPGSGTAVPTGSITYTIGSGTTQTAALTNGAVTIPVLATQSVGNYSVVINYAGDAGFAAAPSLTVALTVTKQTPTVTWAMPAAVTYGVALSAAQLNATASVAGVLTYSPAAGTVLQAGTQTLGVSFVPTDTADYANASGSTTLTVSPAPLTVTAANATRTYGAANPAFTEAISGAVNGDVLTGAATTTATATSAPGTYSIVPTVSGAHAASYNVTPANGTLTITQATTTTGLVASPANLAAGQTLTLTATVAPGSNGTPTGTVTFSSPGLTLGTAQLSNGVATLSSASFGAASYSITAVYGGDANFSGSTSAASAVTITGPTAVVAGSVAQTAIQVGAAEKLTFTLTPSGNVVPTGAVAFYDNGAILGNASLAAAGNTYVATLTPTFATAGANVITMTYLGGAGYATQTTTPITVTVSKYAATVALPAASSFAYGAGGSISLAVTPQGTATVPTGSVVVTIGSGAAQTLPLTNGAVTIPVSATQVIGTYSVTATYSGDGIFNTAAATGSLTITRSAATITWATPAAITYGAALSAAQLNATASVPGLFAYSPAAGAVPAAGTQTLTATFTPTDTVNYATATATVQLVINPAPLAVRAADATRTYGTANPALTASVTGAVNNDTFTASASTTASINSNAGSYAIVPTAAGAALINYTVAATNGTLHVTQAASSAALAVSATAINGGTSDTLIATLASATTGTPTGTVQFFSGTTVVGSATIAGNTATLTTTALPAGTDSLTAVYNGDTNFTGSTSTAVTVTVTAPDYTIGVTPPSLTLKQGASGTAVFTVSSVGGFAQAVSFSCGTLPAGSACVFAPPSVTPAAGGSAAMALTISTTAPAHASLELPQPAAGRRGGVALFAMMLPASLLLLCRGRRKPLARLLMLLACVGTLGSMAALSGCGTTNPLAPTVTATPAGTYNITVTTSTPGGAGHTAALSIVVTQ